MHSLNVSVDSRKLLVERVASSRYIGKSARLRALLAYLCDQVLEHGVQEIHEQEVGRAVFGRAADYDTASDNIVRVHASMLRKRLEQYFASEGRNEPVIIELPKGNYAPLFVARPATEDHAAAVDWENAPEIHAATEPLARPHRDWRITLLGVVIIVLACATALLAYRLETRPPVSAFRENRLAVRQFWSEVFRPGIKTDIVVDDQGVGLYQELTGTRIALSDYFNRNYLRSLAANPQGGLSQQIAEAIVLKRQSSYASTTLLWKISDIGFHSGQPIIHFARDYALRELTSNSAVLLGTSVSNPWIETFEPRLGLRWKYDAVKGTYYPVDTWAHGNGDIYHTTGDSYAALALLPNLSGSGKVLIISSSGGSSMSAAGDFLCDERSMSKLRALLPQKDSGFPFFESLLRIKSRSRLPKDTAVVFCRVPRM